MSRPLAPLGSNLNALVFGAGGGLGAAFAAHLAADPCVSHLTLAARRPLEAGPAHAKPVAFDLEDEASIAAAVQAATLQGPLHLVLVATGILHDGETVQPEKSWRSIEPAAFARVMAVNVSGPALIAKHALPALDRARPAVFAALSARVGSISDNRLGGWHAYRASKAALNQVIRTCAIELGRTNPGAVCIGLHPGTVDTGLSAPFQRGVPSERLFTPEDAAKRLLAVVGGRTPAHSGRLFDHAGEEIAP